jgi:hypothetical protein
MMHIEAALEASGGALPDGEQGVSLEKHIEELGIAEAAKIDSYGKVWRNLEAEKAMCEAEAERFSERARVAHNKLKGLKDMALLAMKMRGKEAFVGTIFKIARQKNGGKVPVDVLDPYLSDPLKLPENLRRATWSADTEAIRAALEKNPAGEIASFARFGEVGYHVRLR